MQKILEEDKPIKKIPVCLQLLKRENNMGIARKENMRICYKCPIMAKEPNIFPTSKGDS